MAVPMTNLRLGIVHPGEMGISVASAAQKSGQTVLWASEGRSPETRERAARLGLEDAGSLTNLCAACSLIVSVCPPHAAEAVAQSVLAAGFRGLYVDANAIAPQRAVQIGQAMAGAGAAFVDGSIIGGPAWTPGATTLYLAGERAAEAAACFAGSPLATRVLGAEPGKASALKMVFAAYGKGMTALLAAVLAAAEQLDVRAELAEKWRQVDPALAQGAGARVQGSARKAWRFAGEMEEIAATFREAGLPGGFHEAAAELYRRLDGYKSAGAAPPLDEILAALAQDGRA
jgi:3-hydroxyisobutyrate dehydrogenase-like beta-hydroxyacid dehydrogenase